MQGVRSSVAAIAAVLAAAKVRHAHAVVRETSDILAVLGEHPGALVVNLMESLAGRDALESAACAILELAGVAYTGAPPTALGLCLDKPLAKLVLRGLGLPTAAWEVLREGEGEAREQVAARLRERVGFPAIVKPAATDASCGIDAAAVVTDPEAALRRAEYCWEKYGPSVLVETFIDGREINVGFVGNGDDLVVLPLAEIEFRLPVGMPRIVTYAAKWIDGSVEWGSSRVVCPADIDAGRIVDIARRAYVGLGCRDYGRVDLRIDAEGTPYVLEVNPNPDLAPDAGLANAARAGGIAYDQLVHRILDAARGRCLPAARVVALDPARRRVRKGGKARVVVSRR